MNKEDLYSHPGWQWCTSEGAELDALLIGLKMPFREKLEWLEEMETLAISMQENRIKVEAHTTESAEHTEL